MKAKATYNTTTGRIYVEDARTIKEATEAAIAYQKKKRWEFMELSFFSCKALNNKIYYIFFID